MDETTVRQVAYDLGFHTGRTKANPSMDTSEVTRQVDADTDAVRALRTEYPQWTAAILWRYRIGHNDGLERGRD